MQNAPFIEKRAFPRFAVAIPLSYTGANSNKPIQVQTHDISAQGLCIVTDEFLPQGEYLDICLQMVDNGEQIYRRGKIIWLSATDTNKCKIGIKLEEPKIKSISIVLRTIKSQRNY